MKPNVRATRASQTEDDPRWSLVRSRDARADGAFVYSVDTTGIYCRPTCGARLARPENVRFHATARAAEAAGFRPCKRCRPEMPLKDRPRHAAIAEACRLIEASAQPLLKDIAKAVGLSPFHFHRTFKAVMGLTPRQYANGIQANRVRERLQGGGNVTDAIYDAGYQSSGKFYAAVNGALGMTPSQFRNKGGDAVIQFAVGECTLGFILVGVTSRGVCAIFLGDDPDELIRNLHERFARATLIAGGTQFEEILEKVIGYVDMQEPRLGLPLDIQGTAFQVRVWQELQKIPSGSTVSYAQLAARIGAPKAIRAVAGACAANALAVAVPCHRVVRNDGSLSGYRWGVERKRKLLDREAKEH